MEVALKLTFVQRFRHFAQSFLSTNLPSEIQHHVDEAARLDKELEAML